MRQDMSSTAADISPGPLPRPSVASNPDIAQQPGTKPAAASVPEDIQSYEELLAGERAARRQAETAARARDEFLAIVSHELRAPLNGIQSWAHVLESQVDGSAGNALVQRALKGIRTGIGQQVRLIEDLLDVTRMMSGKLRLVIQPVALLPVLHAAVESLRSAAAEKHISVVTHHEVSNEQIEGDADRLQQIFWNLLSNGIKFSAEGGNVAVHTAVGDGEVTIRVVDDGAGIAPEFLPHLFDRFSQEDTSSTRRQSGLGLGLFLVRHLTELHGGRASARSDGLGRGSEFSVILPLRKDSAPTLLQRDRDASLPSLEGLKVMVIDDQLEARESLGTLLGSAGANVVAPSSARAAFDWLAAAEITEMPDVLVCDIAMPGEDGYTVLRKLRAWKTPEGKQPLKHMPALAVTAFSQREDRMRALTAGFQMHMAKPIAPDELIVVIAMMSDRGDSM
ncbi:MAG: domain S-box protein [Herminiimonas sp.]|nr:domain S-box protein [Herminiimonas sp.]MDB5852322.1 domain S-box protein [Herminiimonas sp.]